MRCSSTHFRRVLHQILQRLFVGHRFTLGRALELLIGDLQRVLGGDRLAEQMALMWSQRLTVCNKPCSWGVARSFVS